MITFLKRKERKYFKLIKDLALNNEINKLSGGEQVLANLFILLNLDYDTYLFDEISVNHGLILYNWGCRYFFGLILIII